MALSDILHTVGDGVRRAGRATVRGVQRTARGAVHGAQAGRRISGGIAEEYRAFQEVQAERNRLRAEPDYNPTTTQLPVYGEDFGGLAERVGRFGHAYNERPAVRRGVHATGLYMLIGVSGNIASWISGEPSINTLVDMAAPIAAYHVFAGSGQQRIVRTMGLYGVAAVAGWDVATELMAHPAGADLLSAVRDGYVTIASALPGLGPESAGAVAGMVTKAGAAFHHGYEEARQQRARV